MFLDSKYLFNLVDGKIKGPLGGFLRGVLYFLSLLYSLVVMGLAFFYRIRPVRLRAKVISVGNITLGGTGKTTLVEYLTARLSLAGNKIAVLSRGYKRNSARPGACGLGDEPAMLTKKFPQVPVIVDKNRIRAAQKAIRDLAIETFILDDGLQQWRIIKDLEIVTIDATNPFGNHRILPAGFLREPLSALKRADIFILTQVQPGQNTDCLTATLKQYNPEALIVESQHQAKGFSRLDQTAGLLSPEFLKHKPVALVSGIGNPEGFQKSIQGLGIKVVRTYRFADHHDYTQADILDILREVEENNLEAVITTHKDAVKIKELGIAQTSILVLEVELKIIKNEAEFDRRLLKLYSL